MWKKARGKPVRTKNQRGDPMRSGVALSAVMHVALAILIVVGLPLATKKLAPLPQPVAIEIVTIAEITNPPKGKKRAVKAKKPTPKPPQARQAA